MSLLLSIFNIRFYYYTFYELYKLILKNSHLILLLVKKELLEPYAGQVLSGFWTIAHPIFLMLVYTFIFKFVIGVRFPDHLDMPLDYSVYILSGLIPWLSFQQSLTKGVIAVVSNKSLVKQLVFPLEVLSLKTSLASTAIIIIGVAFLFIYSFCDSGKIYMTYLLLPFVIFFQILAMSGVVFMISSIGVFFKDLKDIILLFSTVNIFLIPATYLPDMVPSKFSFIIYLNPFSYMVWVYQDVLYFGKFQHPLAWGIYIFLSLIIFSFGYRIFQKLKPQFGNVL